VPKTTKLDEFAALILAGDADGSIRLLENHREEILSEHRHKVADEDDYYAWFMQDLVAAASEGNENSQNAILALIEEKSFLNETDWNHAFSFAAMLAINGLLDPLKQAVVAGADINIGKYPALTAVVFPRVLPENWKEVCEFLLSSGAKVNGSGSGKPPIFEAMTENKFEAVEYLISHGADLNQRHNFYADGDQLGTPLHFAILKVTTGELSACAIERLVEHGAIPTTPNQDWQGAYQYLKERADDVRDSASEEFAKALKYLSSREEWRETPPFTCPNCAEKVKHEAKTCRFCGQVLNRAVKLGYPEFYVEALSDLDLWRLKYDYIKHANPDFDGSITATSIVGNLFNYGSLDEYYEYQPIIDAMRARECVLAGGDPNSTPDYPERTPNYWEQASSEQQALYLTRKYLEIAQQFTKTFGGRDLRQEPDNLNWAIEELRKLTDLADQTDLSSEEYADHFRGEIERCADQRDEVENLPPRAARTDTAASSALAATTPSDNLSNEAPKRRPNAVLWAVGVVVVLVVLGVMI
jgi:ankyrin repeat protein